MLRSVARVCPRLSVVAIVLLLSAVAAACGATPSAAPTDRATPVPTTSPIPPASVPILAATPTPSGSSAPSATPRCCAAAATPAAFWAAAVRGLAAATHLEVTLTGPNPGILRYEPSASATIVDGQVAFVCVHGAAFDGQSGFARVPGTWECGADALVSGFRNIGQPADSWNRTSPTDSSITERVTVGSDGAWTWAYAGISPFLGGRVTATVRLDATRGRILSARRVDPTGVTTYAFDYALAFPALAVPKH